MPTHAQRRPRSLEVQRAQAEDRRQRLAEQKYPPDVKTHDLEKAKIVVGVRGGALLSEEGERGAVPTKKTLRAQDLLQIPP